MSYLFYSKKCMYSINLLNLILEEGLDKEIIKINIDDVNNRNKIQNLGIKNIPTLIIKDSLPLVGKSAFNWIKNKKYFLQQTNNIKYNNNINNPNITSINPASCYNKNEINKISDSYTEINDKDKLINKSQLDFNKISDNVPITNNNNIEFIIVDEKIGNKLDDKLNQYYKLNELIDRLNSDDVSITNINY